MVCGVLGGCEDSTPPSSDNAFVANGDDAGDSGGAPVGGGSGGGQTIDATELELIREQTCTAYCAKQQLCTLNEDPNCEFRCLLDITVFEDVQCQQLLMGELTCLEAVECEEFVMQDGNSRIAQPSCGEKALQFFTTCTYGDPAVSAECTELCEAQSDCEVERPDGEVTNERCAEDCTLGLTALEIARDTKCAREREQYLECVARQRCINIEDNPPEACAADLENFEIACVDD